MEESVPPSRYPKSGARRPTALRVYSPTNPFLRMTQAVIEHRFTCPYCWESITMLLDLMAVDQSYVEDCEVYCNPIRLHFRAEHGAVVVFDARQVP